MMKSLLMAAMTALLMALTAVAGPIDTYEFPDETTRVRFNALSKELRCPKCQNQNLADSNSPIAQDLRREVYNMLIDGKTDTEIVDFMVYRYGEFVLYRPKVNELTYVLWFAPVALVLLGLMALVIIIRSRRKDSSAGPLSEAQQARLDELLKK
jgi:cytochrome c-type biogenesis protein CcmH